MCGDATSVPAPPVCLCQRLAGLEQRLETAEHVHPAACNALRRLRSAFELVMRHRESRDAAFLLIDLPRHPARRFLGELGVIERPPAVHQPARGILFEDRFVAPELTFRTERAAPAVRELDTGRVEVLLGELRIGDRLPDLL